MKRLLKSILFVLAFGVLTVLTQIGGIVLVLSLLLWLLIRRRFSGRVSRATAGLSLFIVLYLATTILVVPRIAGMYGRVSLPLLEKDQVRPLTVWTALLNRHYVRPELRATIFRVANKMNEKYPGTVVNYLDTGFPFIDKFPLPPHLSHNDGKKADIAFHYKDKNDAPSFIGYGVYEGPGKGEPDFPAKCASAGYRQYGALGSIIPQGAKDDYVFDGDRTRDLATFFTDDESVSLIYIEPHLRKRLGLLSPKVRFHGCRAVRHDDHIHVQIN